MLGYANWCTNSRQRSLHHPVPKPEDLIGIPSQVALALQADGWYVRADVIWAKPNPNARTGSPTALSARTSTFFLLSKSWRYYYNAATIGEPAVSDRPSANRFRGRHQPTHGNRGNSTFLERGRRQTQPARCLANLKRAHRRAHYTSFPGELADLCILAGARPGDLVFDPFAGSGTVDQVAGKAAHRWIGLKLAASYIALVRQCTAQDGWPL